MPEPSSASPDSSEQLPPELARHGRTIDLLGREGFERLRSALVVIVGLGGVGGHAAVALARAGVGRLRLVDFDQVTLSSLNRSAFATPAEVGEPKVQVLLRFLERIDSAISVDPMQAFFHTETAEAILSGQPDFVVDAIDSLNPKVALLQTCVERSLRVVSCMGASARTDPLALRVGDLHETRVCPLARVVRKKLGRLGITRGIPTVYSVERGRAPLPPDTGDETLQRGRIRRRLPSLGILPGIFGYTAAGVVIAALSGAGAKKQQ
jgi:tRNA A37 threonylcarbamoyladenosine dehydratase